MKEDLKLNISYKQILEMALPISFAILVPQFNYLINSLFLAQLGNGYLGISGLTGVYYLIFSVIGFGLNNGLQALISRRAGENRLKEIGHIFTQSIYITMMISIFGIIITYGLAPQIFKKEVGGSTAIQAIEFLKIRIWGLLFLYLYQMRNALLVGTNQSKLLVWGTLAETLTNVIFDYGLIFGHLGLPKLGFNGAAYASIIAECTGMLVVFAIIHGKGLKEKFGIFTTWQFEWPIIKTILVQSSPLILQYAISITSWEFFFILISHDGSLALDVSQLMRVLFGFFGIFIWAFASTANTMVSNIIGQGKTRLVMLLIRRISVLSVSITVFLFLPVMIFSREILSFVNHDIAFLELAIPVLRVVTTAILMMSFSTICLNAVTGTGNTVVNLSIEIFTIILYCVYVYYIMEVRNLSIVWGWASEWVYWGTIYVLSLGYLLSGRWRGKKV